MADSSGVTTYRQNVLLKASQDSQTSDEEALQLSHKILHVIGSDLRSHKQGIREYARNVIRRAGLTGE